MSSPILGQIAVFAGNFAPQGWALCNGQILPISQNTALFSIIGTFYGGNGTSTFALPDLRGRATVHSGQGPGLSPYDQGEAGGSESVGLTGGQTPGHSHNLMGATTGNSAAPGPTTVLGASPATTSAYIPLPSTAGATTLAPNAIALAGTGLPHENRQPLLVMNYMIAVFGIFPSRN
ncbi:MAG TPA: tail fiber protein [Aliidongia sp.]|uniref:phage tail protein n=1 Tax=Aliidongia sp. TaxID=1914230 RepID=UPI002DDD2EBA|nr:tail fiber protein [Aliidongia sp.]HEV2674544.1 tail fiber protein [Aliidongia sp.]